MRRRELMMVLGGTTIASSSARAAAPVIAWISPDPREATAPFFQAFKDGLNAHWPPGSEPVQVIQRYDQRGSTAVGRQIAELQQGVGLIVVEGGATLAVLRAKPRVPVVFAFSGDPAVAGFVESLARPGGNATGISFMLPAFNAKRIELLRSVVPSIRLMALLSNARHPGEEIDIAASQRTAERLGIALTIWRTADPAATPALVTQALDGGAQALLMLPSTVMAEQAKAVCAQCLARKVPVVSGWAEFAHDGALLTYGPNLPETYKRIGYYVARILGGAAPGSLPIEQPTVFELVVNRKVASDLRLTLPPGLIAEANEIIE